VIVWQSGKAVFTRLLDGVEPEAIGEIRYAAREVVGVEEVSEVRARWLGHRLHAEVNVAVDPGLSVAEGHAIAREVWDSPARADTFTLRDPSFFHSILLEVRGTPVA
jgi:divalent metal cation (Fe/Co/Zn/Cd) transporter